MDTNLWLYCHMLPDTCTILGKTYHMLLFTFMQDGFTPLHIACQKGRAEIVGLLLQNGASPHALTKVFMLVLAGYHGRNYHGAGGAVAPPLSTVLISMLE